jgi:gliding motility-associated-like protein
MRLRLLFLLLLSAVYCTNLTAQCNTTINTFPYVENFETSQGGWASGGTLNDWAWGAPAKPVINRAGSGLKCWITGGLDTAFYNYGERSYVTSPCFDFTNLQHPFLAFLIFWESEHTYDGMVLQYSLNAGNTWKNVGSNTDAVNCMSQNWYNTLSIDGLSGLANPQEGWTGNIKPTNGSCQGGFGSQTWVQARHCLSELAGQPSVKFRFAFGAGTTCNSFDGIAFDSVSISEAPVNTAAFTYTCLASNQLSFAGITTLCPDSFAWNFGDPASGASNTATTVNATHTFSAPGSYTVSFTAGGPCNAPATFTKVIDVLKINSTPQNVLCFGDSTGSINLTITGGTGPYLYNWSTGSTSQNIINLGSGTYTVSVSDTQSCSATASISIAQPVSGLAVQAAITGSACSGSEGINLTVSGGTGSYTYNWGGGITSQNRTGLGAGTYTVTVTDQNNCTATASKTISVSSSFLASASATNVLCYGNNSGSITLTITGGISPFTYNWGGGITTQNRSGLVSGIYTVTVTDSSNCSATASAVISQPVAALTAGTTSTNASCVTGGTITTSASGGTGTLNYNWGGGVTTQNRSGLWAGTYTITVTDQNGCMATASATIISTSSFAATLTPTNVSCNGGTDGSITDSLSGGHTPYVFNWGGGVITQNRSGLSAGTYSLTVTDSSGCIATSIAVVGQPQVLNIIDSVINISCNGAGNGSIITTVSGGNVPYTYNWGSGITSSGRTGLGSGTYNLTVTDSKSCTASVSAVISQPQAITLSAAPTNLLCNGNSNGSIALTVQGGTDPDTYSWTNGATSQNLSGIVAGAYKVTVTDSRGCTDTTSAAITQPQAINVSAIGTTTSCTADTGSVTITVNGGTGAYSYSWSNGATSQNINLLSAGSYMVTVKDANNCTVTGSATVTPPTNAPHVTLSATPVTCNGDTNGQISLNIVAGNYTYTWSNGQSTQNLAGLVSGPYTVTVHDGINCSIIETAFVGTPQLLVINVQSNNVSCFDSLNGSISSIVSGGTGPYTYVWSNGAQTAGISNLGANTYNIIVTDSNACTASANATISQPARLAVSVQTDSTNCGLNNGNAQVTVTGGSHPYLFVWSPNVSDSSSAIALSAGSYAVTVTDSSGCLNKDSLFVYARANALVAPYLGPDTSICPGTTTITLTAGNYASYLWQDSSSKQIYTVVDSGTFWVRVMGTNGCTASDTILVSEKCDTKLVIPNAFSPNGDGKNDFFLPLSIDNPTRFLMHIYDRWGALIFESNNIKNGWDGKFKGKDQPTGTYIYYIQYAFSDNVLHGAEGAFTLLR